MEGNGLKRWKWILDDIVLISFATFCLGAALFLRLNYDDIEPTFIAAFLGVAVAAITYRYLGGTESAKFSIAALQLGGSAALLFAVMWWVGDSMTKQHKLIIDSAAARNEIHLRDLRIAALEKSTGKGLAESERLTRELGASDAKFVTRVAALQPNDPLVDSLRLALRNPTGAGRRLARQEQVRVMNSGAVPGPIAYWICRDSYDRFYPDQARAGEVLRVSGPGGDGQPRELDLRYTGDIDNKTCGAPDRAFDIQVSCDASMALFPDVVARCDGSRPIFARDSNRVVAATAGVPVEIR